MFGRRNGCFLGHFHLFRNFSKRANELIFFIVYRELQQKSERTRSSIAKRFSIQEGKIGRARCLHEISDDWDPPPLHFNISHTSSLIGIDVEEKHRRTKQNTLSFARRYFSECEVRFLAAISDPQVQQTEFIKLWTLKEAYVKALGKGFSGAPFKTFTIRFKEDTCTEVFS